MNKLLIIAIGLSLSSEALGSTEILRLPVESSVPVYSSRTVYDTPVRVCETLTISSDEYRSIALGGAIVGALLGHVITRKLSGSTVNRVLGTAAGGIIGSNIEKSMNQGDTTEIQDCRIEHPSHQESYVSGYNVSYTIDGRSMTSFLLHDAKYIKLRKSINYRVEADE
jgi:uncharacterized protein YcfJ